jgi:chemotaxis protein MotB
MRRRHIQENNENHDRWLVSYSDFITLLLALFVVMYAISQVNEVKHRDLAGSLVDAFGNQPNRALVASAIPGSGPVLKQGVDPAPDYLAAKKARRLAEAQRRRHEKMENIANQIMAAFDPFLDNGKVRVSRSSMGIRVEIDASVLFAPGRAELQRDSGEVLEAVAHVLKNIDDAIQVEGHTDNVPIETERFPSNWELSAVRASSVVRLLIAKGVSPARLTAAGYGETRPLEPNDSEEGRRHNRRVTVMVLSGETVNSGPDEPAGTSLYAPDEEPDLLEDSTKGTGTISSI